MVAAAFSDEVFAFHDQYRWGWRTLDIALVRLDIAHPNDCRDIYEFTDALDLSTMGDRGVRERLRSMYRPVHDALSALDRRRLARPVAEVATGWPIVDQKIERVREQYAKADTSDDWRDVGRSCDGLLEAVGRAATDALADRLPTADVSPKDASERIRLVLSLATGESNKKLRKLVSESAALADEGTRYLDASASLLGAASKVADAADNYANSVKHAARLEQQAAIAAESAILIASIARHAVAVVLAQDDEPDATP